MAVARASSAEDVRTGTTDPHTFVFTPAGTPRGIAIAVVHGVTATPHCTAVTYGGVALEKVAQATDTVTEPGVCQIWFVGKGIPTGAQTVSLDLTSGTADDIHTVVWELSGAADLEVFDKIQINENAANPQGAMVADGKTKISLAAMYAGGAAPGGTLATGNTADHNHDLGNFYSDTCYETTVDNANHTIGWSTLTSDDLAFCAISISEVAGDPGYLNSNNRSGAYASTPDHGDFDVTDLEFVWCGAMADWSPAATVDNLIARWSGAGTLRQYYLAIDGTNANKVRLSVMDGITQRDVVSTIAPTVTDGNPLWIKVDLDADGGPPNTRVRFWTSTDAITTDRDAVSWTQLGSTVNAASVYAIPTSTATTELGARTIGVDGRWSGRCYYASISNAVGGAPIAETDWRYDTDKDSVTQLTDSSGKVWTVNGNLMWVNPISTAVPSTFPLPSEWAYRRRFASHLAM